MQNMNGKINRKFFNISTLRIKNDKEKKNRKSCVKFIENTKLFKEGREKVATLFFCLRVIFCKHRKHF